MSMLIKRYWCPATYGAKSIIKNTADPSLTVFLNDKDKYLICQNLVYMILGLSTVITIIIVYGALDMRKKKQVYTQVSKFLFKNANN